MQQNFAGFGQANPDVKVDLQFIGDADYQNRLSPALRGANAPISPSSRLVANCSRWSIVDEHCNLVDVLPFNDLLPSAT